MVEDVRSEMTDNYKHEIPVRLPKHVIKELSQVNGFKSAVAIIFDWGSVIAAVYLCEQYWNPLLYVATVLWIGTRIHALAVLMHDGAHYRLFKNRKLNDFIGEVFLAWPASVSMRGLRQIHWAHHSELNTENDPDWSQDIERKEYDFPKTKKEIGKICLKYLCGYYAVQEMKNVSRFRAKLPLLYTVGRNGFYGLIVISSIYFGFWNIILMYWLVPLFTAFLLLLYIRQVADHHAGLAHDHIYSETRTLVVPWWEALIFAPHNISYHIGHHFYPSVPFYNLKKLHKILLEDPEYKEKAHITHGFTSGLLKECNSCERLDLKKIRK